MQYKDILILILIPYVPIIIPIEWHLLGQRKEPHKLYSNNFFCFLSATLR